MNIQEINTRSKQFEKEIIGTLITFPERTVTSMQIVSPDDFYYHADAYNLITFCYLNSKSIATEFINKKIKLSDFVGFGPTRSMETICRDLKEVSSARKVYTLLERSLLSVPDRNLDVFVADIQQNLIKGISKRESEQSDIKAIVDDYRKQQKFYEDKFKSGGGLIGLSTGYEKLDEVIDGLRPEHLWIIGGYTNMGKTFASLNIVAELIKQGKRIAYYSIEMSKVDILSRLLGILTEQNGVTILKSYPHDTKKVDEAMEMITNSRLSIYSGKSELSEIQFSMYEENLKDKVDLFVVDFIQLMTVKNSKSEYETVTACALELQQMAKKLKCPIIALSQISNEGARNTEQDVMSFKGSGAIASSADMAIEIVRGEDDRLEWQRKMNEGEPVSMKWIIRKNRHGRVGFIPMDFTGKNGIFKWALKEF